MKAFTIIFIFALTSFVAQAQTTTLLLGKADSLETQAVQLNSAIDQLAIDIQKNARTPTDRLMAIHNWVAGNIKYDTDSMYLINWKLNEEQVIEETMRRRRGVCQNYSIVFNALARKCGIESFVVEGFTKQHGRADKTGHTWVAVKINEDWAFCDPTWDKDDPGALRHFLVSPDVFIQTHIPFDPLWQLLPYEVSVADFYNGNTGRKTSNQLISYKDSLSNFALLNPLQRLEAAYSRMHRNAESTQLYKNQVAYVKMKMSIFYEEQDLKFYHQAVADFNEATRLLNQFLTFRNSDFLPAKPYEVLTGNLEAITHKIKGAQNKINEIGAKMKNEACDPSLLKERIVSLEKRLAQEKLFLQNYFVQNKALK